jgi:aspartyl-tRNA(Asn)/glutamyl-tRNA(Gln) amidotransferase subunit C
MSIEVTHDLVKHVARLARMAIDDEDIVEYQEHFRKVLAYVAELQSLETDDVSPSHFAAEAFNVYRKDAPGESLPLEAALRNAPQGVPPFFIVPRILGGASDAPSGAQGGTP